MPVVRFFYYDGKAIQGPLEVPELLRSPGFGPESVVCPAGSRRSEDWKPAVNYDELREALLKPKASAPPVKCPVCAAENPGSAVFCNSCGGRMDGKAAPPAQPKPAEPPAGPAARPPMGAGPMAGPMKPASRPGGMGRIGQPQPAPMPGVLPAPAAAPVVAAAPVAAQARPRSLRLPLIAAVSCVLIGGSLTAYILRKKGHPQAAPVPAPAQPQPAQPVQAPPEPVLAQPQPAAPPGKPSKRRRKTSVAEAAAKVPPEPVRPKWGRKKKASPSEASEDAAPPPGPELSLPGIPNRVPLKAAAEEELPAPEPSRPSRAPASDSEILVQSALEQFSFCHQLMRQGAFDDAFESCLCSAVRAAEPYNGSKGAYVEKSVEDPQTEAGGSFEVLSAKAADGSVLVSGRWTLAEGSAVERQERWTMEEGRWCLTR